MCNPWVVCQKKVSGSAVMWVVSVLTTSRSRPCWWPSPICISHRLIPLPSASPVPYPSFFACYEGLCFNVGIILKGTGYLRCRLYVQRYDSCSTVDGPSWAACRSTLLMANLLVFSAVHQRLISHGGKQESLGYRRAIAHVDICAQGAEVWFSCGRRAALEVLLAAPGRGCLRSQSIRAGSLILFFHILPASIWQPHFILSWLGSVPVCVRADPGPGLVWILSPLAFGSGSSSVAGLSLVAHCKRQARLLLFIYLY